MAKPFPALNTTSSQLSTGEHTLTLLSGIACRWHPVARNGTHQQISFIFLGRLTTRRALIELVCEKDIRFIGQDIPKPKETRNPG